MATGAHRPLPALGLDSLPKTPLSLPQWTPKSALTQGNVAARPRGLSGSTFVLPAPAWCGVSSHRSFDGSGRALPLPPATPSTLKVGGTPRSVSRTSSKHDALPPASPVTGILLSPVALLEGRRTKTPPATPKFAAHAPAAASPPPLAEAVSRALWPTAKLQAKLVEWKTENKTEPTTLPSNPVGLLLVGSLNPLHLGHLHALMVARAALEARGCHVMCSWLIPSGGPPPGLRLHAARQAVAELHDTEVSEWLVRQVPQPSVFNTMLSLQAAVCAACPELQGTFSVFVVRDVFDFERDLSNSLQQVNAELRCGVVVVPRHGEEIPRLNDHDSGFLVMAHCIGGIVGQCSGPLVRAALVTGDDESARILIPEAVARCLLYPSPWEEDIFCHEFLPFRPPSMLTNLLEAAARRDAEAARPQVEALRSWLDHRRGGRSMEQALSAYDIDADGSLSAEEFCRLAVQADIPASEVPVLLRGLGCSTSGTAAGVSLALLADRLEGREVLYSPAAQAAREAQAAAHAAGKRKHPKDVQELALMAMKMQAELRDGLLRLVHPSIDSTSAGELQPSMPSCVEDAALLLMRDVPWRGVYQVVDEMGSTVLLLASSRGLTRVCQKLLTFLGPTPAERVDYVNRRNQIGWTALQRAAQNGHLAVCEQLLLAAADPNLATKGTHLSPLMLAASYGHLDIVRFLLDVECKRDLSSRSNPWQLSSDGRHALEFVRARIAAFQLLAEDHARGGCGAELDMYGVRTSTISESFAKYFETEKTLVNAVGWGHDTSCGLPGYLVGFSDRRIEVLLCG